MMSSCMYNCVYMYIYLSLDIQNRVVLINAGCVREERWHRKKTKLKGDKRANILIFLVIFLFIRLIAYNRICA